MECFGCSNGKEAMITWENEMMALHGWYVHCVPDDTEAPNNFNCHTHGISDTFNHPDLQICMPMRQKSFMGFFHLLVGRIRNGERFKPDVIYPDIMEGDYKVTFISATECGRPVLRLIFPNADGNHLGEKYQRQFMLTEHNPLLD